MRKSGQMLGALIVLNLVLLLGLMVSGAPAQGVGAPPGGDYMMVAGEADGVPDVSVVYILERNSGRLGAVYYFAQTDDFKALDARSITDDLR